MQPVAQQALAALGESGDRVDRTVALAQNAAAALATILESAERSMTMSRDRWRGRSKEQARATKHLHEVTARMSDHVDEIDRGHARPGRGDAAAVARRPSASATSPAGEARPSDEQLASGARDQPGDGEIAAGVA